MIKKKIWAIHEKATSRHDLGLVKRLLHIHQTPETMLFLLAWLLCYGVMFSSTILTGTPTVLGHTHLSSRQDSSYQSPRRRVRLLFCFNIYFSYLFGCARS